MQSRSNNVNLDVNLNVNATIDIDVDEQPWDQARLYTGARGSAMEAVALETMRVMKLDRCDARENAVRRRAMRSA